MTWRKPWICYRFIASLTQCMSRTYQSLHMRSTGAKTIMSSNKSMVGGWTSFQSWQTNGTRNMYHANFKATLQSSKKNKKSMSLNLVLRNLRNLWPLTHFTWNPHKPSKRKHGQFGENQELGTLPGAGLPTSTPPLWAGNLNLEKLKKQHGSADPWDFYGIFLRLKVPWSDI